MNLKNIVSKIPEFCMSHWLLRVPLIIVFAQQGLDKIPVDPSVAEAYGLPYLVWWIVAWGELGAAIGLFFGGIAHIDGLKDWIAASADLLTRFSGFTIGCIMTGVIWIAQPESFWDVLWYDNFHVLLWVGGLFFALRGNKA